MGNKATVTRVAAGLVLVASGFAQTTATQAPPDWKHIGNAVIDLGLADPATGPVQRVWYSADGSLLRIQTSTGKLFETNDFETWASAPPDTPVPPAPATQSSHPPEIGAQIRIAPGPSRVYAFGMFVYRSDDLGAHWTNLTAFKSRSLIGGPLLDLAVSPVNPDEIVAVGANGVFRTLDAGLVWSGLNEDLPNLPAARILALPTGSHGLQAELGDTLTVEWPPGERQAWRLEDNSQARSDHALRGLLSLRWAGVTAVAMSGDYIYAGTSDGWIHVSADAGVNWQDYRISGRGAVNAFSVNPGNPRSALAALTSGVFSTISAGFYWDSLSDGLVRVSGITVDWSGNAVYCATGRGVFLSRMNLTTMSAAPWTLLTVLPPTSATDVRLDAGANRLWVAMEGTGIYEGQAPHRMGSPRIVSSADYQVHPAAPGTLLSVAGARLRSATAGPNNVPVLDANDSESQIQIPYTVVGSTLTLNLVTGDGTQVSSSLPLNPTSPAIWVNPDGSPYLTDADNVMLDASRPTHPRARIQILATGLGAVQPYLTAGTPAPSDNPPQVVANVTAWLDGQPVQVVGKAVLAPGMIGFYLVEIEIPSIANYGPAELYIEADNQPSNRVRVYIDP